MSGFLDGLNSGLSLKSIGNVAGLHGFNPLKQSIENQLGLHGFNGLGNAAASDAAVAALIAAGAEYGPSLMGSSSGAASAGAGSLGSMPTFAGVQTGAPSLANGFSSSLDAGVASDGYGGIGSAGGVPGSSGGGLLTMQNAQNVLNMASQAKGLLGGQQPAPQGPNLQHGQGFDVSQLMQAQTQQQQQLEQARVNRQLQQQKQFAGLLGDNYGPA